MDSRLAKLIPLLENFLGLEKGDIEQAQTAEEQQILKVVDRISEIDRQINQKDSKSHVDQLEREKYYKEKILKITNLILTINRKFQNGKEKLQHAIVDELNNDIRDIQRQDQDNHKLLPAIRIFKQDYCVSVKVVRETTREEKSEEENSETENRYTQEQDKREKKSFLREHPLISLVTTIILFTVIPNLIIGLTAPQVAVTVITAIAGLTFPPLGAIILLSALTLIATLFLSMIVCSVILYCQQEKNNEGYTNVAGENPLIKKRNSLSGDGYELTKDMPLKEKSTKKQSPQQAVLLRSSSLPDLNRLGTLPAPSLSDLKHGKEPSSRRFFNTKKNNNIAPVRRKSLGDLGDDSSSRMRPFKKQ